MGFLDASGNYYEGDQVGADTPVPIRPSKKHTWSGSEWLFNDALALVSVRAERDVKLSSCDWIVLRHRDQVADLITPTLSDAQYQAWLEYRQALRNFPATCTPANPEWPTEPS